MDRTPLRDFLEIPYDKLEEMNLEAKQQRLDRVPADQIREEREKYLRGREADQGGHRLLHRPRRPVPHARLRQEVPAVGGRQPHVRRVVDSRLLAAGRVRPAAGGGLAAVLLAAGRRLRARQGAGVRLRRGARRHAVPRRHADAAEGATPRSCSRGTARSPTRRTRSRASCSRAATPSASTTSTGSSSSSRPAATTTRCRATRCGGSSTASAEVQRALGFANEKDHPEVAPSQFEMNYSYTEACVAADQVQLYKLICRQVAQSMDMTASFLPKPVTGVNGSGMHTNLSLTRGGRNLFWDAERRGPPVGDRLELHRPHPDQRQRHLPDPQLERQRLPPARPALRGAEPDQGVGDQPRRDGPHPARQREVGAHRGPLDRPRREPVPGHLHAAQDRASRGRCRRTPTRRSASRARASCPTTSTTRSGCSSRAASPASCSARRCRRSSPR